MFGPGLRKTCEATRRQYTAEFAQDIARIRNVMEGIETNNSINGRVREIDSMAIEEQELRWFDFANGGEITVNRKGLFCSRVYPGLWIDGAALLARQSKPLKETLGQGLASRAHAAFVKRLERARRKAE